MSSSYSAIVKSIQAGSYAPLYLLMGEEPYFIDAISKCLEDQVLATEQKAFNQLILYGRETQADTIAARARRHPLASDYQLIIVREAQMLRNIDALSAYAQAPSPFTILVLDYKYKRFDARKQLYKAIAKRGVIFDSKRLYEDQIPAWITASLQERGYAIEEKAKHLLTEFLGTDLSRIHNELDKLTLVVPSGQPITAAVVEHNIGISKDYNNFELIKALGDKDVVKANRIITHFGSNPKAHPLAVTLSLLYTFFANLIYYHTERDRSVSHLAAKLGINRFFVADYRRAGQRYSLKKVTRCLSYLREADLRSKGLGAALPEEALLRELVFKILH